MSNSEFENVRNRAPVALEDCGMAQAAELIGDRWILLILREAFYDVVRYDDMRKDLGIARSVLTDRLQKLLAIGIMERQSYRETHDRERMSYALTQRGRELAVVMLALLEWGNRDVPSSARYGIVERSSGQAVRVGLINSLGIAINTDEIVIRLGSPN